MKFVEMSKWKRLVMMVCFIITALDRYKNSLFYFFLSFIFQKVTISTYLGVTESTNMLQQQCIKYTRFIVAFSSTYTVLYRFIIPPASPARTSVRRLRVGILRGWVQRGQGEHRPHPVHPGGVSTRVPPQPAAHGRPHLLFSQEHARPGPRATGCCALREPTT